MEKQSREWAPWTIIRSLHLLLEVVLCAEEECLFFLSLGSLIESSSWFKSVHILSRIGTVLEDEQAVESK